MKDLHQIDREIKPTTSLSPSDNILKIIENGINEVNSKAVKRKGTLDYFVTKIPKIDTESSELNNSATIIPKKKCPNPFDSSDSESNNSEYEDDNKFETGIDDIKILDFFNNSSLDELNQVVGCSEVKARKIIDSRPYTNMVHLKSNKIITQKIIDGGEEILSIKDNLSKLLKKCEVISANLTARIKPFVNDIELSSTIPNDGIFEQPKSLSEGLVLKSYQLVGINWIRIVHEENLNGILADEMGLGKTIQTIGFLSHLVDSGNKGPHIIIVPTSTLNNWVRELRKWCPTLKVVVYYGSLEERKHIRYDMASMNDVNILLTTYNICISNKDDRLFVKKMNFHYGIFDEAHMLKNMLSIRYQYISNFKIKRKLLLTGTPLQNNLVELISLLSFVMPTMFLGSNDDLKRIFQMSLKNTQKQSQSQFYDEKIQQIKEMLAPFCLRRLKSQVLTKLPLKTVEVVRLPLSKEQERLYNKYIEEIKVRKSEKNPIVASSSVMELRKISNHSLLVKNEYNDEMLRKMSRDMLLDEDHITANQQYIFEDFSVMHDFEIHRQCLEYPDAIGKYKLKNELLLNSNKIQFLDENLPIFIKNGDKVLIFSQFIMVLDIMAEFLNYRNYAFLRLDGSTSINDRQDYIDDFNDNEGISIFLLTTKAGGIGINLTSANVVIIHDIDYNPFNDRQAEDRSHRIGQLRDVRVIKLISSNTVEECMLEIATGKLKLEEVTGGAYVEDDETKSSVSDSKDVDFGALLKQATDMKR